MEGTSGSARPAGTRRRRLPAGRRLLFSLLVLLFVPVFLEAVATVAERALEGRPRAISWGPSDPQFYVDDPLMRFRMRPDRQGQWQSRTGKVMSYSINSIGCRDTPVTSRTVDVLFLGDSCTFGEGLAEGEPTYVDLLESRLEVKANRDLEFLNAGVPGYCTTFGNIWYQSELSHGAHRVVVVWLGWNDRWWNYTEDRAADLEGHWVLNFLRETAVYRLAMKWFQQPLRRAYHAIVTRRKTAYRPLVPPDDTRANLVDIVERARARGATPILMTSPSGAREIGDVPEYIVKEKSLPDYETFLELVSTYNDRVREAARQTGAPLVDLEKELGKEPPEAWFTDPRIDAIHPDVRGHRRVADLLQAELEKALGIR